MMRLFCVLALACILSANAFAQRPDEGGGDDACVQILDYTVEPHEYYGGDVQYDISFLLSTGTNNNYIRIHQDGEQGETFSVPFHDERQVVSVLTCGCIFGDWFSFDVYDVLPNGKVVMCSVSEWISFSGEQLVNPGKPHEGTSGNGQWSVVSDMTISPNPASETASISYVVPFDDPASTVDIIDAQGNTVATVARALVAGSTVSSANLQNLPVGAYTVRMRHANGQVVQQLRIIR